MKKNHLFTKKCMFQRKLHSIKSDIQASVFAVLGTMTVPTRQAFAAGADTSRKNKNVLISIYSIIRKCIMFAGLLFLIVGSIKIFLAYRNDKNKIDIRKGITNIFCGLGCWVLGFIIQHCLPF